MDATRLKVGDLVEVYERLCDRIVWLGVVVRETPKLLHVRSDLDVLATRTTAFSKKSGAERPQYVTPRFVRARSEKGGS